MYSIDMAHNYGPKERLLTIEVSACGDSPSVMQALPMGMNDGDEYDDDDDDGLDMDMEFDQDGEQTKTTITCRTDGTDGTERNNETNNDDDDADQRDRYLAYVDPDVFVRFISGVRSTIEEKKNDDDDDDDDEEEEDGFDMDMLWLLLTFPYYEHEWDLVVFLMDCLGLDGDDVSDDHDDHDDDHNDDDMDDEEIKG